MENQMTSLDKKLRNEAVQSLANGVQTQAEELAQQCLADSSFNAAVSGSNWYVNYNKIGVVARVIYGENTFYQPDQDAIMWVIVNRMITEVYEGNTILEKAYNVVIKTNQFDGLTSARATQSQSPSDSGWHRAVYLACVLSIATGLGDIMEAAPKPAGIENQTLFYSASALGDIIDDSNETKDRIENITGNDQLFGVDSQNNIMIKISQAGGSYYWCQVSSVASAGVGSVSGPLSSANLNPVRRIFLDRSVQNAFVTL